MKYVLYHTNCYDGFGAAYACWKKFGEYAKYKDVDYNKPFPREFCEELGSEVYVVDFSYPREELLYWADFYKIIVLDHHKTAQENLKDLNHPNLDIVFDMDRSGALITWEYLHTVGGPVGGEVPDLIHHISDRDLWKFKLNGTKEIHKALVSYPMDFELWDTFDVNKLKEEGKTCERLYNQLVENICKKSWFGKIGKYTVPMVNTSIAWSEVGHKLLEKYPEADFVASFTEFEKEIMWSLRSRENFDCSVVAKTFGGGGHKQASGFKQKK